MPLKIFKKGGYVQISAEKSDAEVKIIVEDNGNGISKEDIEHILIDTLVQNHITENSVQA